MKAPLYNKLIEYSNNMSIFHMPGHKFGKGAQLDQIDMIRLDDTEAKGLDNLYVAEGVIKEAMTLMADFYGSKDTIFLTNGSTAGILASILAICKPGDQLIIARNTHHSVWSGLILAGVCPVYITPNYLDKEDILGEIQPGAVREALNQYPEAKGVLIVSPTYEGIVSNIEAIADIVHEKEGFLIVDEAHGAHFVLGEEFPISSIKKGADLVINSTHKTLPALTQSALLHICTNQIKYEKVIQSLRMIQTSSPSYMMMGIMDYMRAYIIENRASICHDYIEPLKAIREELKNELKVLELIEPQEKLYDKSKIIISTAYSNISGYELEALLNEKYHIAIEAALENYIILMTTMADNRQTLEALTTALCEIDCDLVQVEKRKPINPYVLEKISLGRNPRDIYYSEKEWIRLEESINRIASKNIMLYPPGIPIIAVGEKVKAESITFIKQFNEKLQGIKVIDNQIVIEVVK